MILSIPLISDPSYRQRIRLDGRLFIMRISWNARLGLWSMLLSDSADNPILSTPLVSGMDLLSRSVDPRCPPGALLMVDTTEAAEDPTFDDLGSRFLLVYYDASELTAA